MFAWQAKRAVAEDDSDVEMDILDAPSTSADGANSLIDHTVAYTRWGVAARHFFNQPGVKTVCATFHPGTSLLIVGFSSGVFGLWEMPTFTPVHTLSISSEKISSVAVNPSGEWLAFGAAKLGQLLVWEWQSESYVLKQQGHYYDMNCLAYSPDAQNIATGGEDGKVKLWNASSGFCFVTFPEHSAGISAVEFAKGGQVLFSASLDGTVRVFDLTRYRNFRTFTSPTPAQFCSLDGHAARLVLVGPIRPDMVRLRSISVNRSRHRLVRIHRDRLPARRQRSVRFDSGRAADLHLDPRGRDHERHRGPARHLWRAAH